MAKPLCAVSAISSFVCVTVERLDSELELDSVPVPWVMESALASDFHSASDSAVALLESVSASDSEPESDLELELVTEFDSVSDSQSEPAPSPEPLLQYPLLPAYVEVVCLARRVTEQTNTSSLHLERK